MEINYVYAVDTKPSYSARNGGRATLCRACAESFAGDQQADSGQAVTLALSRLDTSWFDDVAGMGGIDSAWRTLEETASDDGVVIYAACDKCAEPLITITRSEAS